MKLIRELAEQSLFIDYLGGKWEASWWDSDEGRQHSETSYDLRDLLSWVKKYRDEWRKIIMSDVARMFARDEGHVVPSYIESVKRD